MLSYRHQFHAGNPTDVFKHAMLTLLLQALARKPKPFFMLDTHAGVGRYDLEHPWSAKTGEWRDGIGRIWGREGAPPELAAYLAAVAAENPDGQLRRYPGSPAIARRLMRPEDRLALFELNADDRAALERTFRGVRKTTIQGTDGFAAVRALLPPVERRGLVFIDASFDQADEFQRLLHAIADSLARFASGTVAVWHPIMDRAAMGAFAASIQALKPPKTLQLELTTRPDDWAATIPGSGMIVVNPPYRLDAEAAPALDWLWRGLTNGGAGGWRAEWLVAE